MEGANLRGSPPGMNELAGDELNKRVLECALMSKEKLEQTFEEDTLAVAILDHSITIRDCTEDDFHWFKLKPVSVS